MKSNAHMQYYPQRNSLQQTATSPSLKPINGARTDQSFRKFLESTSFVIPNNKNCTDRSLNPEILRDSSTQTSKTLVSLNADNSPRLSPDSLSPKTEYYSDPQDRLSAADRSFLSQDTDISFTRKSCILRYLHKIPDRGRIEMRESDLPDNSLTKAFLAKRKSMGSPRITRTSFLEQTSPLRNIIPISGEKSLKSQSHLTLLDSDVPVTSNVSRFRVKNVREKLPSPDRRKPVKYFCENEFKLNLNGTKQPSKPTKNRSFMSPTFSSEQKNKMNEINTVTSLISPTRRGRSASPKAHVERSSSVIKKVPYIDKSSSSIFHGTGDGNIYELNLKSCDLNNSNSTIVESTSECPERDLMQAINKLRDLDWNTSLRGLAEVVEICRNTDSNMIYPHMTVINQRIIEMLKSPRSHVCRTTCKAVGHLFEYVQDTRRPEFDEIVDTLLCRTADSNKFIKHDANLALDCMVTHIPILHAIRSLCAKGPDHKNALVRIATARLVVCAVVIAGSSYVLHPNNSDYTRRRIIQNMVKFLNDKTMETRKYGERLYKLLHGDRMFELYIRRYLEKDTIQKLKICFKKHHNT